MNLRRYSHCLRCFMATSFSFCCTTKGKVVIVDILRSTELEAMKLVGVCVCVCVCACVRARARACVHVCIHECVHVIQNLLL